jgi:vacuolar-type H+-ATPase subunit H
MNALPTDRIEDAGRRGSCQHTCGRKIIPALVFFLAGAALSAVWFSRNGWHHGAGVASSAQKPPALLEATRAVLQHLDSPVEIRFYTSLDASSVPESVQAFAGRVDQLLAQYEQAGGNRVRVMRCNSSTNFSAKAAQADDIRAFNNDKGDACFLGIAVECDGQKQSLPRLAPEWEQALEPDLTRAIARAAEAKAAAHPPVRSDPATLDAVKRLIPNLDAVSLEAGTKVLRDAELAKMKQAREEMEAQVKDARQRFLDAQGSQSEAAQQAAREHLQKTQEEAADKLRQIALNSQAQIAALQQLKKAAP